MSLIIIITFHIQILILRQNHMFFHDLKIYVLFLLYLLLPFLIIKKKYCFLFTVYALIF